MKWKIIFAAVTFSITISITTANAENNFSHAWTQEDTTRAAEIFMQATNENAITLSGVRLQYAENLIANHDNEIAKKIILETIPALPISSVWANNGDRGKAIELLTQIGYPDAQSFIDPAITFPARADLFAYIGIGAAKVHNTSLAIETAQRVITETPPDKAIAILDPLFYPGGKADLRYIAITRIANALVDADQPSAAQEISALLPNEYKNDLDFDLAMHDCSSSDKLKEGQSYTDQYVSFLKTNNSSTSQQYLRLVVNAVELKAMCFGAKSGLDYAAAVMPGSQSDVILDRAVNDLIAKKKMNIAFSLDMRQRSGSASTLVDLAGRFIKEGHLDAAFNFLTHAASKIESFYPKLSRDDQFSLPDKIANDQIVVGAYDAMLQTLQYMDPNNRDQYLRLALRQAAAKKDDNALHTLIPSYLALVHREQTLDSPPPSDDEKFSMLIEGAKILGIAGYTNEANSLLAEAEMSSSKAGNDYLLADGKASVGDIAGAQKCIDSSGAITVSMGPTLLMLEPQILLHHPSAALKSKPGPKADAIDAVVTVLAQKRDFDNAQKFAAELDTTDGRAAVGAHNGAYSALSSSELEAGLPEAALASAEKGGGDPYLLLKFSSIPISAVENLK